MCAELQPRAGLRNEDREELNPCGKTGRTDEVHLGGDVTEERDD